MASGKLSVLPKDRGDGEGKPLAILMVAETRFPQRVSGVDTQVSDLMAALGLEHRVVLFAVTQWEWSRQELARDQVGGVVRYRRYLRLPWEGGMRGLLGWAWHFPRALTALVRIIRREGIDLLHLHSLTGWQFYFRLAARWAGVPYVVTVHGSEVKWYRGASTFERASVRFSLRGAAAVNTVSRFMADFMLEHLPLSAPPAVIANGLTLMKGEAPLHPLYHESQTTTFTVEGQVPEEVAAPCPDYFMTVGGFYPGKGHDLAIRALALVRESYPGVGLLIVGEGGMEGEYRRLIAQLGLTGVVHLLGHLPREGWMALARRGRGVLFPSRFEGLSYVVLECGALGVPLIGSAIPSMCEVLTDGVHGRLVAPDDPSALAQAMVQAVEDPEAGRRMAEAFRQRVLDHYGAATMAKGYEALYRGVLGGGT